MASIAGRIYGEVCSAIPDGTALEFRINGVSAAHNTFKQYRAASLIKVPLAIAFLQGVEKGKLSLDAILTLDDSSKVLDGSSQHGSIDKSEIGTQFLADAVLDEAMTKSDNSATNMLIEYAGMDAVNQLMEKKGYRMTVLARKMADSEAKKRGEENYTCPQDIVSMFDALHRGEILPDKYCKKLLEIMGKSVFEDKLTRDLPDDIVVPRKGGVVGEFRDAEGKVYPVSVHDAGVVYAPKSPYVIAVFTEGMEKDAAKDFIAKTSRKVFDIVAE
jgi:beta-lactamase class A